MVAQSADWDDAALGRLQEQISSGDAAGVHSVLVVRNDQTITEWYFAGDDETIGPRGPIALPAVQFAATTLHDVRSVTKSVVSILFGIAVGEGAIGDLDAPVLDYFPEYPALRTPDRMRIRLRDVLTMSSGLHWDERTYPYSDARNSEIAMEIAPDLYAHVLSQPIDQPPGARFNYSGGDVALVGAIITRATHTPLEVYAKEKLFGPLGITRFEWTRTAGGIPRAASGLRLTSRDMGRIGELMLHGGRSGDRQIVSEDWVASSTTPHIDVPDSDATCPLQFGYLWWLSAGCGSEPAWFAGIGNGGQRIWVVPSHNLIVAMTAGLYNDSAQGAAPTAVLTGVLTATHP